MIRFQSVSAITVALLACSQIAVQAQSEVARAGVDLEKSTNSSILNIATDRVAPPITTAPAQAPRGNLLWGVPLQSLAATRERPLFSPSRRPPPPPPIAFVPPPKLVALATPEPDHPLLSLLGTIVGSDVSIGVFLDQQSNELLRLKVGETHAGWLLRSVAKREAHFEKARQTATVALPARTAEQTPDMASIARLGKGANNGQMISPPPLLIRPPLPQPEQIGQRPLQQEL